MGLARIREEIGKVWGATTTLVLALSVALLPVLQGIDPEFVHQHPFLMWAMIVVGVVAAAGRVLVPPPPSVPIHIDDAVSVDHANGTVTIAKDAGVPSGIVSKEAGEKM